jgi:outer membrane protein assembly factor BamB
MTMSVTLRFSPTITADHLKRQLSRFGLLLADARGRAVLFVAAAALAFGAGGAVAAANAAASQVTADWTQWAFNARHTGYNSHETALNMSAVARLKPVFATSLVTQPDPIVVNGKVYLSNNISGFVQAVDATTGAKLWTRGACGTGEETSDPAFAGGSVWVGLADPGLAAVGAGGTSVKCVQTGDLYPTPPSAAGGTVYAGGEDGVATAVDAVTGQVRWIQQVAPAISLDSPAVSPDGRFLLIGSANGTVYELNAGTGRVLWSRFIDTCASSAV